MESKHARYTINELQSRCPAAENPQYQEFSGSYTIEQVIPGFGFHLDFTGLSGKPDHGD